MNRTVAKRYTRMQLRQIAHEAAERHGVRPELFVAQIRQESGFNPKVRSRAGAIGVAQIMPGTARVWGVNPWHPVQALNAAARNMSRYIRTYQRQGHDPRTSERLALAAYNAGPGAVARHNRVPRIPETQRYVKVIMANAGGAK